jgi:hypothetical protein
VNGFQHGAFANIVAQGENSGGEFRGHNTT